MDYVGLRAQSIRALQRLVSGAQMVEEFLEGLLSSSRSLYIWPPSRQTGFRSKVQDLFPHGGVSKCRA